jgi:hypothetical protein
MTIDEAVKLLGDNQFEIFIDTVSTPGNATYKVTDRNGVDAFARWVTEDMVSWLAERLNATLTRRARVDEVKRISVATEDEAVKYLTSLDYKVYPAYAGLYYMDNEYGTPVYKYAVSKATVIKFATECRKTIEEKREADELKLSAFMAEVRAAGGVPTSERSIRL